ncbi:MAG TPA: iron ABC transporter permease [Planctomycetaceae bacterium]|nr:iron ABC transporter permease [Planctomycetaceae bacterium]
MPSRKHQPRTLRPPGHRRSITRRLAIILAAAVSLPLALCVSIGVGAASVPMRDTLAVLCGFEADERLVRIIMNIRLPQALTATVAGAGLAVSGATMQGVLRNPLASPFTLGISNAAAFGAALTMYFHGMYFYGSGVAAQGNTLMGLGLSRGGVATGAFLCAILAAFVILVLGRLCGTRSETIVLVGVALSSLFTAGLLFLQYMADDMQLAAIVYWTFGDTARAGWNSLGVITACLVPVSAYFWSQSWNYNALLFGEETAQGLGVPVRRLRMTTMLLSSFLTAVLVSLLGIIGFIGLVVPHVARILVGSDNRFLLPFSLLFGGLLLLVSDTFARLILAPRLLPVSVLTAFIGAPVFLSLLLGKRKT